MKKIEIHLNTRGCKKPMDPKTVEALAELFRAAYKQEKRKADGKRK